ncbi:MAG: hypothetical protein QOJ19_1811 [Acidimicrobiia bacterium]|jgi:uncharacterized protein (TIGR00288 family)|nr:hypothetical protein [Acidimicrobiia bacterium]
MPVRPDEERIALFLDYENLAIGARDHLSAAFDVKPVADALAERGRVVVRKAYADWTSFKEDGRSLAHHHIELIEIPQRMGAVRKNAADIKLAVDAIELCFERDYISTFVIGTGDSDFTPLVLKLRELNKLVIGLGVGPSTSNLLPPACDEFLFYEQLQGVDLPVTRRRRGRAAVAAAPDPDEDRRPESTRQPRDPAALDLLIVQTLSGMERSAAGPVLASTLKRAILRKDPTFQEAEYGFRGFLELIRNLEKRSIVRLGQGVSAGDPEVQLPDNVRGEDDAFALLRDVVNELSQERHKRPVVLSGLKNTLRKKEPQFSEKQFGYGGFLQFCQAARARGFVSLDWDDNAEDYVLRPAEAA